MSQVFFDVEYTPIGAARKLFHALPTFILLASGPGVQLGYPSILPLFSISAELCSKRAVLNLTLINAFESFY
jgi:hypothetical protein